MMRTRLPTSVAAVALAAVLAAAVYLARVETREPIAGGAPVTTEAPSASAARGDGLVMRGQRIVDERGRVIFAGDVDLGPVFARIAAGTRDPHRNDGATFANREGRLPRQPRGYYTEWVVRTPGTGGVGPQRLVTGRDGDAWYTPDHYETFVRVRPPS